MKRKVIFDSEANGLTPTLVHCIVCKDVATGEVFRFVQGECYTKFKDWFEQEVESIVGHNLIDYDIPKVLGKLLGITIDLKFVEDTFVLSRLSRSDRYQLDLEGVGGDESRLKHAHILRTKPHSLQSWGIRCNRYKPEIESWDTYTPEILTRCEEDCEINLLTYKKLIKELEGFSKYSIRLEHRVAEIISEQMRHGVTMDREEIIKLHEECSRKALIEREEIVREVAPIVYRLEDPPYFIEPKIKEIKQWDGGYTVNEAGRKVKSYTYLKTISQQTKYYKMIAAGGFTIKGPFSPVSIEPFNPDSPQQRLEILEKSGWNPVNYNKPTAAMLKKGQKRGTPKTTDEENLSTVPDSAPQGIKKLGRYVMFTNRATLAKGWLELLDHEDKIHGYIDSCGTPTGRCTHNSPQTANIPAVETKDGEVLKGEEGLYGWECRKCFTVHNKDTHELVGFDASSLEIRMLAHYLKDDFFTQEVLNGDIYVKIQQAVGLPSRKIAKAVMLALIYGAGDPKLGTLVGGGAKAGKIIRDKVMNFLPKLKELTERVQREAKTRGYLIGLDGRKLWVRKQHAALNTLLQSAGAIVMKVCLVLSNRKIKEQGLETSLVLFVHDEYQFETKKACSQEVCSILVDSIKEAGRVLRLNIALDGSAKRGDSWARTH